MSTRFLQLIALAASLTGLSICSQTRTSPSPVDTHHSTHGPNQIAGTWSLVTANITTNGSTTAAYGPHPVGVLIFAPTMYFSELISVDPSNLPRFPSDTERTSGTPGENAAVIAGILGQVGTYTVDAQGLFQSTTFLVSTFPNWIGLHRTTKTINETVVDNGSYMKERLQDHGSDVVVEILWKRMWDEDSFVVVKER